jgi:predicted MPP superfamily phosphohydrolase
MKIHLLSDVHTEFKWYFIPEMEDEENTIVIFAGDIGLAKRPETTYLDTIKNACRRFKHVFMIMGNHEYWRCSFNTTYSKIWNDTLGLENFDILEKETKVIDGVAFIGACLWTDMDKGNPVVRYEAQQTMRDYKRIRIGSDNDPYRRPLKPLDTIADNMRAKEYIFPEITKQKEAGNKVVVITHHAPSFLSVAEHYKGKMINGAYCNELGNEICDLEPELWVHGHTHYSFDYMIHNTRIVCNPRGYAPDELNEDFIDDLILEV